MTNVDVEADGTRARLSVGRTVLEADLTRGTFSVRSGGETVLPSAASAVTFGAGEVLRTDGMPHHDAAAAGDGLEITHHTDPDAPALVQRFRSEPSSGGVLLQLCLCAGHAARPVGHLHPVVTEGVKGQASALEPGAGLWMWRFGTVSPGDPVLFLPLDSPHIPETHDRGRWLVEEEGQLSFTSEMLAVFRSSDAGRTCLLGFVTVCDQATGFTVTRSRDAFDRVHFESRCDLEALSFPPKNEVHAETLLILPEDDAWRAVETYTGLLAERYTPRLPERPLTGWSDWQYYRREITEEDVIENIETLAAEAYPIEYILVDDGYQRNRSDWLVPNERFPHGIKWLAERIREKGFKPGIWIAPLTAHASSELAREHPDWLVRDAHGHVLTHDTHMGKVHAVDYTVPEALEWLRSLVRTLVQDYGYRWIK
ncbi:MAG TPA: alpha-galactosidase, partial [Planctomycetota bacterium]|nr:alpha-galactosidase [Planctomycetota bacterium]